MSSVPVIRTAEPEWLSKNDAAAFLNVSPRQIERRAAQGYVETRRLARRPTERSERVEYSRADLEAIRDGRPNQHGIAEPAGENSVAAPTESVGVPVAQPAAAQPAKALMLARTAPVGDWEGFLGAVAAAVAPPPHARPWLTLDEAAEFAGLPKGWLLREARAGNPIALNVGSERRAAWRFSRELLTARVYSHARKNGAVL